MPGVMCYRVALWLLVTESHLPDARYRYNPESSGPSSAVTDFNIAQQVPLPAGAIQHLPCYSECSQKLPSRVDSAGRCSRTQGNSAHARSQWLPLLDCPERTLLSLRGSSFHISLSHALSDAPPKSPTCQSILASGMPESRLQTRLPE